MSGGGLRLSDANGREYLDANASIWTNLHGHAHPRLNAALRRQMGRISHLFGAGPRQRARLAAGSGTGAGGDAAGLTGPRLEKVFFSDNGSTALEVALKLAWEFTAPHAG